MPDPKGTASGAFAGFPLSTFPLAGKTGTATTNEQQPNSWFVGWGPLPDPQYLIAVVVQGGGYGAQAAAPVVRQGFDYLVAHPETAARLASPLHRILIRLTASSGSRVRRPLRPGTAPEPPRPRPPGGPAGARPPPRTRGPIAPERRRPPRGGL